MVEVAFRVDRNSDFYKQYFHAKEEKQKFHDYARAFFEKYDLLNNASYYQEAFLGVQLTDEQKKRFDGQLKKNEDKNGMTLFKKSSPMQKEWTETVVNKIDMKAFHFLQLWYFPYINCGSYNLWDEDGEIYGHLTDRFKEKIELGDGMIPIKMSEYYAVIESFGE